MFDEPTICLLPFTEKNLYRIKGWDGFIDPDGNFYKVIERDRLESPHDPFVEALMRKKHIDLVSMNNEIKKRNPKHNSNYSLKSMLINVLGYVNYEYVGKNRGIELGCPNPEINNKNVTVEQIKMIEGLIELNHDNYFETMQQIFNYDRKHNIDDLNLNKVK